MFLRHSQCPNCERQGNDKSKDNLGIYSDGEHCFSCGYTKKYNKVLKDPLEQSDFNAKNLTYTTVFPDRWISKFNEYHLNQKNIYFNKFIRYCPDLDRLSFWYSVSEKETFQEYRSLNREPKVFSYGKKPWLVMPFKTIKDQILVIVEDIFSAIRISENYTAFPLFGSSISDDHFKKLLTSKTKPVLWLDRNKLSTAREYRNRFSAAGLESSLIFSRKDPKYYFNYEIKDFVSKATVGFALPKIKEEDPNEKVVRYNPMTCKLEEVPKNSARARHWLEKIPDWFPSHFVLTKNQVVRWSTISTVPIIVNITDLEYTALRCSPPGIDIPTSSTSYTIAHEIEKEQKDIP